MTGSSNPHDHLRIRPVRPSDIPAVTAIQHGAPEAAQWAPASWILTQCYVAELDGLVCGFAAARRIVEGEGELLTIAVALAARRKGVATALLDLVREQVGPRLFLEVRESNAGAIAFYERSGFRSVGRRNSYYSEPVEAAIVMES